MEAIISTKINGVDVRIIRDGSIIFQKDSNLTITIDDLRFEFTFRITSDRETPDKLISSEFIKDSEETIIGLRIIVNVEENEFRSAHNRLKHSLT